MTIEKPTTVQFHLEVLRQIPKSYSITADELQKKMSNLGFERSLRTVQRTLDSIFPLNLYLLQNFNLSHYI
ncbi:hypothetical protein QJU43_07515 [Pasteurella atlantica]|uniref:hypothetical protein n=1 Tax=Pasteurellaceae TaxID=712 RepID=UPI00274649CA|nr:hypothetical protein [Pasteurella atlantica]MDP8034091.1 hypothetical protein [Pasteurella atlantica]MDP8036003.1 hypothetical protein [Pasteurella atlantica]MDP8037953.1 hypothetical protein [Pasteurella atlantica]MDP8048329.1 hypothetical protein [Pasteurella atlantica]MDP8050265.1 hypothetical protein [Pasteurella atlantica]